MVDKKRRTLDGGQHKTERTNKKMKPSKSKTLTLESKTKNTNGVRRKNSGPRLPAALQKQLHMENPELSQSDEDVDSDEGELLKGDVYEYEEEAAEEESKRNRRFDPVDDFEYELPEDFEDEDVPSDDDNEKNHVDVDEDDDDGGKHVRMLQRITGMPSEAFEGKKRRKNIVVSEAYPESEYNPSQDVMDGEGHISIQDLLDPLHGKSGYSKLRKRMHQVEKKSISVQAPLPKADRDKLERMAAYKQSKKDITKWDPLVKKNREAPTIYFDEDTDLGFSTVGAIASEFQPRTEFEKKMASLVQDEKVVEAYNNDGSRLLELNKISIEDVKKHRDHRAKLRNYFFCHEMKLKRIAKIKSKTYHRLLKKDRLKAQNVELQMDPEAAKDQAMKQEAKRAEERMTLKHKNNSKWAKRILKRGLEAQDDGTRAAISEQLNQHALLTRKMNSMKEDSSSDDDSDEDDVSAGSDQDAPSKLFEKAKEKTLQVMEEEDEMPKSGVLSLPFMVRGLKKKKDAANEEANLALQEYESSMKQHEVSKEAETPKVNNSSGRRVFGAAKKVQESNNKIKPRKEYNDSDSEEEIQAKVNDVRDTSNDLHKDVHIDPSVLLPEDPLIDQDHTVFQRFDDVVKNPGSKTTYEVAIFASDSWKKVKSEKEVDASIKKSPQVKGPAPHNQDPEEVDDDSDSDSGGQMVDGILSTASKPSYEFPSQAELIQRAFAGDDVEEEFEKDKQDILNEENPEPEKPVLLPGWGQWTNVQKKKGLPNWMVEEHKNAQRKREEALKLRKDAQFKHVIISEKLDKKAEKFHTKTLPYPYTSKEVFEQSIRMPIGPEYNPATAIGALTRPEVVKKSGVIIKPIKFEEVNPHERAEDHKGSGQKQMKSKSKSSGETMKNKTQNRAKVN